MGDEYPKKKFTVKLDYTVHVPEDHTHTTTIEAEDEETAIREAWNEVYDNEGCDDDEIDEGRETVVAAIELPCRGSEDNKTVDMFGKKKSDG